MNYINDSAVIYNLLIIPYMFYLSSCTKECGGHKADELYPGFVTSYVPLSNVWFSHLYTKDTYFLDLFEDVNLSLVCCSPWGRKESDMTEQLNNNSVCSVL